MAIAGGVGAECDLDPLVEASGASGETAAFGEGPGGYLMAGPAEAVASLAEEASAAGVACRRIGAAGDSEVRVSAAELELSVPLSAAESAWRSLAARIEA